MKTSRLLFWTIGIGFLFCSCQSSTPSSHTNAPALQTIDLIGNLSNEVKEIPLSHIASSVDIVPLETREECIIGTIKSIILTENDILILQDAKKPLLRFSREGKFLNTIIPIGKGPQECYIISQVVYDPSQKQIYVTQGDGSQPIKVYDLSGKFIKSIPWNSHQKFATVMANLYYAEQTFFWNQQLPVANPQNKMWNFAITDSNLHILKTFRNPQYQGKDQELIEKGGGYIGWENWYEEYNPVDFYQGKIKIMYHGGDTLYRFDQEKQDFLPSYTLKMGPRPGFGECRVRGKDLAFFQYLWIYDFDETCDYIYLYGHKDKNRYIFEFDKQSGKVQTKKYAGEMREGQAPQNLIFRALLPVQTEGFLNDLCGIPFYFYPTARNENSIFGHLFLLSDGKAWVNHFDAYTLIENIDPEKLKATQVLEPEKRDQFIKILSTLTENSNPVLFIANLK